MTTSPRITAIRWHPYRLPLRQPFATAHGVLAAREGAIVELVTDAGMTGYGDMAAVTEFGSPSIQVLLREGYAITPSILGLQPRDVWAEIGQALHGGGIFASLPHPMQFALETAAMDANEHGSRTLLELHAQGTLQTRPIPVNATIGAPLIDAAIAAVQVAMTQGFRCIKLKVGMLASVQAEIERVRAVRAAMGSALHLRLDANEAWTLPQALAILDQLDDTDIQFVEQPLPRDALADMRQLREQVHIPVAADEALTDLASVQRVLAAAAADVLVLKPQMLGGYFAVGAAVRLAMIHDKQAIVTTSLESGVGVAATYNIAKVFHAELLECGLATLPLLEDDLIVEDLPMQQGMMTVPASPGLGVQIDWEALARYRLEVPAL